MAAAQKNTSKDGAAPTDAAGRPRSKNAQRVLILSSRGITTRQRHFLNDIATFLPHSRKETKFDSKRNLEELNELASLYNCNNIMFMEARKHDDLYMHISKAPNGPRAKFRIQNMSTMSELNFTGNCLKGSRPILSFDAAFDTEPHSRLLRELLSHSFGVPQGARRVKPFIDRVLSFTIVDGRIWARHYQVQAEEDVEDEAMSLVEIGPRFCLTPIFIQEGSFGGPILFESKQYVSSNQIRPDLRAQTTVKHKARSEQVRPRKAKKVDIGARNLNGFRGAEGLDTKQISA